MAIEIPKDKKLIFAIFLDGIADLMLIAALIFAFWYFYPGRKFLRQDPAITAVLINGSTGEVTVFRAPTPTK